MSPLEYVVVLLAGVFAGGINTVVGMTSGDHFARPGHGNAVHAERSEAGDTARAPW